MEENYGMEPEIVKTNEATDKKCDSCGGVMDFNPSTGTLKCPYCGFEKQIEVDEHSHGVEELDFSKVEDTTCCDWGTKTKTVICKSCGAETVYDANDMANECPYCGSNQIMEEGDKDTMAPGGVVPFAIDAKKAAELFKSWIGKKFFCPKLAKESAKPKSFKGLYIPYWTFDSNTTTNYRGEYGIDREVKDKEGNTKTVTDWYPTRGTHEEFFDDTLVCGSTKQDTGMLQGLEPFNTGAAVEYKAEYMAGFVAERYSLDVKSAWEKAKQKIKNILHGHIREKIKDQKNADSVRNLNLNVDFRDVTYKYLLLPVWISAFQYKDKVYQFMVNGQTGKVTGKTPISWIKVGITVVAVIAIIALIYYVTN